MSFHINNEGNIDECEAKIKCPFGSFDKHHYLNRAEAQIAYEAAMEGKKFSKMLKSKKQRQAMAEFTVSNEEKKVRKMEDRIKKEFPPIPTADVGYYADYTELSNSKVGDEWPYVGGGKIISSKKIRNEPFREFMVIQSDGTKSRHAVPIDERGKILLGNNWIDKINPEELHVRQIAIKERDMAVSLKYILSEIKPSSLADMLRTASGPRMIDIQGHDDAYPTGRFNFSPRNYFIRYTRKYKDYLDKAQKAGVANPYQFAMAQLENEASQESADNKASIYDGRIRTRSAANITAGVLRTILEQNDHVRYDDMEIIMLDKVFKVGEVPGHDYSFESQGTKFIDNSLTSTNGEK